MWQVLRKRKLMSIRSTDFDKDQEAPRDSQSLYTANTVQQEKVSPVENLPQPPNRPPRSRRSYWYAVAAVLVVVALIFSVFAIVVSRQGLRPGTQVTPTPTAPGTIVTTPPGSDTTPSPTPGVTQGPQNGPPAVSNPAYWDTILGTQGTNRKVESVSFANVLGTPTLQALVAVRHSDASSTLDVYVFDKITSAKPTQLFNLSGLIKGDAQISYYNSIMTAQVDKNSALNAGKSVSQWTPDLFREFAWSAGSLSQVAFPGIFPDLTRYQAEADQAQVNKGHETWKNDPVQVAKALEARFIGWQRAVTTKLLSGGGPNDVYARVQVQEGSIEGSTPSIVVTLSRLEGNTHNMWVAVGVADGTSLTLKNLAPRQLLTSPVTLEGTGAAFEAVIGQAVVYDHLYTDIGHAQITGSNGIGLVSYTTQVSYTTSFNGVQEGMVTVYENNGGFSAGNATAVMMKVLLSQEPGVTLGPVPGPDKVKDPSYWTPFVSSPPAIRNAYSVSFGHLLGNPSLQAVVVATDILGGGPVYRDIFVFDKITDPKPQLLFQVNHLLHGNAQISGYSTVMTAQVDVHSSINTNKLDAALTTDLFREFKWSDGTGTFVPTAFPGLFPDLTRWQAEADQTNVNAGQDAWKTNAAQVAQRMAAQLLQWPANAPASIVSGGGPQDVDAVAQVKGPNPGGMSINVTLSRLEGNTSNMWVVIGVTSGNGLLTINTPVQGDRLTSPTTITGSGSAFEGVIGQAFVLDHLYTTIGQAQVKGGSNGKTTYTVTLPYTSSFQGGTQEGIVVVYMYSQANGSIATAAMQKVMIGA
jgi:hypothetical protein